MKEKDLRDWLLENITTGEEEVEIGTSAGHDEAIFVKILKDDCKHSLNIVSMGVGSYTPEKILSYVLSFKKSKFISNKLRKNPLIDYLLKNNKTFTLVGGAVIDIYEGRYPKDYDFTSLVNLDDQLEFVDTSSTADTYIMNIDGKAYTVQILKTKTEDFDYTISTCHIKGESVEYARYEDEYLAVTDLLENKSYKTKILIPCSYKPKNALSSLLRVPHWREKGYKVTDNTYRSLLFAAADVSVEESGKFKKES